LVAVLIIIGLFLNSDDRTNPQADVNSMAVNSTPSPDPAQVTTQDNPVNNANEPIYPSDAGFIQWIDVDGMMFIPSTWRYEVDDFFGYLHVYNEDGTVHMFVSWMDITNSLAHASSSQPFVFDNGHIGYMMEFDSGIHWVQAGGQQILLNHEGNRAIFTDNEEEILIIARSFIPTNQSEAQQVTTPSVLPFTRADYLTGITVTDLLRFPDNHIQSKVYFEQFRIDQIFEPGLYIARDSATVTNSTRFIVIDNRGNSGQNALVGDRVTIYGRFLENVTMEDQGGRREQMPYIDVDLLIFNSFMPSTDDLAKAFIAHMNVHRYAHSHNNQWLSDSRIRFAIRITHSASHSMILQEGTIGMMPRDVGPRSDGYGITVVLNGLRDAHSDSGIEFPTAQTVDDVFQKVWIYAEIVNISQNMFDATTLTVTMNVERVELYG